MLFNSFNFIVFCLIVVMVYFIMPHKIKYIWLLGASYYFYMCWNPKYSLLIILSTAITFLSGILLGKDDLTQKNLRRCVMAATILLNLGMLVVFKYGNFIVSNINQISRGMGWGSLSALDILLPVGISFYVFQGLGYTIDVYRRETVPEKNFFRYALFISFFPQLVAGPIERSGRLLCQLKEMDKRRMWSYSSIAEGFIGTLWGFFLKVVIADRLAIFVDCIWNEYRNYGTIMLMLAAIGFSLQIYCDFSGYSAIAIGVSKIMRIEIMQNFNTPYFARSIKEFWQRWHISLSTWFKDYLYIPLGGNRCSEIQNYCNLLTTFLLSGLWHGAGWNFVIWGALHGLYQIAGRLLKPLKKTIYSVFHFKTDTVGWRMGECLTTFLMVTFAWIFFRSESFTEACSFIHQMIFNNDIDRIAEAGMYGIDWGRLQGGVLLLSLTLLIIVSLIRKFRNQTIDVFLMEQPLLFRWAGIILILFMILIYGAYGREFDAQQFVYFQF